jgi:hypothetical protein
VSVATSIPFGALLDLPAGVLETYVDVLGKRKRR